MKQVFPLGIFCIFLFACNSNQQEPKTADGKQLAYPFTPRYSINWRPGDENNALLVLNCLKKYVDGDIKGCASYFADTAEFIGDKFYFRGSRDSLEKIVGDMRHASATARNIMINSRKYSLKFFFST